MAFLPSGFDANEVKPNEGFSPIPAGDYTAAITESEYKKAAKGSGKYLALVFTVLDGQYKGRKLYTNLNLENANAEAVRIARGDLSAICRAIGVMKPRDSVELHNIPLTIAVGHKKRSDNGELANVVKGYRSRTSEGAPAPTSAASAAATNDKPWKRKKEAAAAS